MTPARLLFCAILVGTASAVMSCADRTSTGPGPDPALKASIGSGAAAPQAAGQKVAKKATRFLRCKPLPPGVVAGRIGPEGGVIDIGSYRLVIPAGALERVMPIRARIWSRDGINVVAFEPDGLALKQLGALTMSYATCDRPDSVASLQIVAVDTEQHGHDGRSLHVRSYLQSTQDTVHQTVTGDVPDFTNYAGAW